MLLIDYLSIAIIPFIIITILMYAYLNQENAYDAFLDGVKKGIRIVIDICPTLIALLISVSILRNSGLLSYIGNFIGKLVAPLHIPSDVIPLFVVKMFSSSAATGLLLDIYKEHGTDSFAGLIASISLASTETIFYTMSVFFGSVKIKKTRYTLPGALIATLAGCIASIIIASFILKI